MSGRTPIVLLGAGGHARACIDVIEQQGTFAVAGLVGLPEEVGSEVLGYRVVGSDGELASLLPRFACALVTMGQIKTPEHRIRLFSLIEEHSRACAPVVSPRAYVSRHAMVGAGTIVMHGAVINAGARVGRNCIVNSQSLVEHDVVIDDHCHVSTGATVNSGVSVGWGTFIGSNASIRQGVNIGTRCVIGMGQRVLADCAADSQVPARKELS